MRAWLAADPSERRAGWQNWRDLLLTSTGEPRSFAAITTKFAKTNPEALATLRAEGPLERAVADLVAAAPGTSLTLLWAAAEDEDRDRLIRHGARSLLLKPVTKAALIEQIAFNSDHSTVDLVSQAA